MLLVAPVSAAGQGDREADARAAFEALREAFAEIRTTYLDSAATPERRARAQDAADSLLAKGIDPDHGWVAAEMIYQGINVSAQLARPRDFLDALAEAAYAHHLGDTATSGQYSFLLAIGNLEYDRGEYAAAAVLLDSFLQAPPISGMAVATGSGYNIRGFTYRMTQDYAAAARAFDAAVEQYGSTGHNAVDEMVSLSYAARAYQDIGDLPSAEARIAAAFSILEAVGQPARDHPQAYDLFNTSAAILASRGDHAGALARLEQSIAHARRSGNRRREATALQNAGFIRRDIGDYAGAIATFEATLASLPGGTAPRMRQELLTYLAAVYKEIRRLPEAYRAQAEALAISDSLLAVTQALNAKRLEENAEAHRVRLELAEAETRAADLAVAESRRQLALAWGALAIVSLVAALGFVAYRLRRKAAEHDRLEDLVAARTAEIEAHRAELESRARQLERSNHELERFAYIASHDLKTPIRNVTSFLGLIRRRLAPAARAGVEEYLDLATAYAHQMHALVTDVLEFSRIDADLESSSEVVDVAGLLGKLSRQLAPSFAARNGRLEISGTGHVSAPPAQLTQVLTNLIENGLKYNRSVCPTVSVTVGEAPADASDGGPATSIRVTDNGIGIAAEYRERVFGMFKRLHTADEFEGTGLGLAVCRKVCERLGGAIALESAEGEGSTFTVTLPAAAVGSRRPSAVSPRSPALHS